MTNRSGGVRIQVNTNEYTTNMSKTITLRLDDETYAFFRDCAAADNRTLSNLIETSAKRHLEGIYMDPREEAAIMRNKALLKRLRAGTRDAKARRGRMVG